MKKTVQVLKDGLTAVAAAGLVWEYRLSLRSTGR